MPAIAKTGKPAGRLPSIQVLRALAASVVVFHHYGEVFKEYPYRNSWIVTSGLSDLGISGVDLFFVISGFIMVFTTVRKGGMSAAATFLKKRFCRILPLYWFWSAVLLILWYLGFALRTHHHTVAYLIESFLLLPAYPGSYPLLQQGWTLSFELFFYCLFACAMWLRLERSKPLFLAGAFMILMLISPLMPLNSGPRNFFSNTIMFEFLFGAVAATLVLRYPETRSRPTNLTMIAVGALLLIGSLWIPFQDSLRCLIYGVPSFFIVLGCAWGKQSSKCGLLVYLGDASYSIYLIHELAPLFFGAALKRSRLLQTISPDWTILVLGVITIAITSLGYPLIEQPLQRALSRGNTRKTDTVSSAPPRVSDLFG